MERVTTHSHNVGKGKFQGWAYVGIPLKVYGNTPEEVEKRSTAFFQTIVRTAVNNPNIQLQLTVPQSIACFLQSVEAAEKDPEGH